MTQPLAFVSYARDDGSAFAAEMCNHIRSTGMDAWHDGAIVPGIEWEEDIDDAIEKSWFVFVVLTPGARLSIEVRSEWRCALRNRIPVVPVKVLECDIPTRLSSVEVLDLRSFDHDQQRAQIVECIRRLPERYLHHLKRHRTQRIRMAEGAAVAEVINACRQKIEVLDQHIRIWEARISERPDFLSGPGPGPTAAPAIRSSDNGRPIRFSGTAPPSYTTKFRGREEERLTICSLIADDATRLISVIGRGGVGKTALACRVLDELRDGHWPATLTRRPVNGIAWLSTRTKGVSLERIFLELGNLLDENGKDRLERIWQSRDLSDEDKVDRLLSMFRDGLYIILLDNLEDLLGEKANQLPPELSIFFCHLARELHSGLRVLITTRSPLPLNADLKCHDQHIFLIEGLSIEDGVKLLRELDPNGTLGIRDQPDSSLKQAVEKTHGMPLALRLIVRILGGDDTEPKSAEDWLIDLDELMPDFHNREIVMNQLVAECYRRYPAA